MLASCGSPPVTRTGFLLDTVVTLTLYDGGDEAVLDEAMALCAEYEAMFSRTDPGSAVSRLNRSEGAPVAVPDEVREVLERSLYYAALTDGRYDVTICPVVDLWDFTGGNAALPNPDRLREALERVGWHNIVLEEDTVRLTGGAMVDLGSIAKGYIADRMAEFMRERGVRSAVVYLGGDIVVVGDKPGGEPFRIGIQKPFGETNETIGYVEASDRAVVSSGIYERSFLRDGVRYHHILDVATGYPSDTGLSGVTVLADTAMDGDALSTCLYLLGLEQGMAMVEGLEGVEAIFLTTDGEVFFSSGFGETVFFVPNELE